MNDITPRIGLYWLHGDQVLGLSCALSQAEPGVPGLLDSPFTHVDAWEAVRSEAGLPPHIEYDDLPRGRVLYSISLQRSIVYGDRAFLGQNTDGAVPDRQQCVRGSIASFFSLPFSMISWRHDDHYTVGRDRIDSLLDE